jgi:uncharacterized protein YjbI with pentapeptide repeats
VVSRRAHVDICARVRTIDAPMNPFENETEFEERVFENLDLEGADLGKRELTQCVFRRCKLGQTRWARTRLEDCVFEHCDLTRADVAGTSMHDVTFKNSKLMGVDFTPLAKHPAMTFEECMLRYASFVGLALRKVRFVRCAIQEANFFETDLTDAVFEECAFTGTRIEGCTLLRAKFPSAKDLFLDPVRNKVKGAHVPLETAILLATSHDMKIIGFEPED